MEKQASTLKVFSLNKLSAARLKEVKRLVALCKRTDGFAPVFYWNSIENRRNPGLHEFLCYSLDSTLVGYLSIYHFEEREVEITLAVHPDYRAFDVHLQLFAKVKEAMQTLPVEINRYVFTCHQENNLLKTFLTNHSIAKCVGITRQLALTARHYEKLKAHDKQGNRTRLPITVVLAEKKEIPALSLLGFKCFGVSEEDYHCYLTQALLDADKRIFVIKDQDKVIGKLHAHLNKKDAFLYDLCIDPAYQNQGLGGALLCGALEQLFAQKLRQVIVDVSHETTFNWYEKFQFKCVTTYEHWTWPVFADPLKQREKQLDTLLLNFQSVQVQQQLSYASSRH
jgi:ribosomal protein S18 acetylase RimI-like enzyme